MPKNMKFIVTGRAASGKHLFLEQLQKRGFIILPECVDHEEVLYSDVILLDPPEIYEITEEFPDIMFRLLYINATDERKRAKAYIEQFENEEEGKREFEALDRIEDERFIDFERKLWNNRLNIPNISAHAVIGNNYESDSEIFDAANAVLNDVRVYERVNIILDSVLNTILNDGFAQPNSDTIIKDKDGSLMYKLTDGKYMPYNQALEMVCSDDELLGTIMHLFLEQKTCPNLNGMA